MHSPSEHRHGLTPHQQSRFRILLEDVLAHSGFYRAKFGAAAHNDPGAIDFAQLPLTTRQELEADQAAAPPYGTVPTCAPEAFTRFHQTSGSSGRPLLWPDTPESWSWWQRCWRTVYEAAGVQSRDRFLFPFSFGPFIGFWSAFETAAACGNLVLPAGGLSTAARLNLMLDHGVTVVCCTPTYALRMAEVAATEGLPLAGSAVRALIVAGEPGGNIPATRARIETVFGARVFDHAGATEVGAWGFECEPAPGGLHVNEREFIAEVIDPQTAATVPDGTEGELVLTNLGRSCMPVIRYRTGDQVTLTRGRCSCGREDARLEGGLQGRLDDMVVIRGNNVFPSTVEGIVRSIPDIVEFRVHVGSRGALSELAIEIEPHPQAESEPLVERVRQAFVAALHFQPQVRVVAPGTLPRFDMKARRMIRGDG